VLVASYELKPGNGEGLFWFWHFLNSSLTYSNTLLTHLLTVPGLTRGQIPEAKFNQQHQMRKKDKKKDR